VRESRKVLLTLKKLLLDVSKSSVSIVIVLRGWGISLFNATDAIFCILWDQSFKSSVQLVPLFRPAAFNTFLLILNKEGNRTEPLPLGKSYM